MKKNHLSEQKVGLAMEMLKQGVSYREIARRLRMSPCTIRQAALGRTPRVEISDDPFTQLRLRAKRCPGCGGLVYIDPCPACSVRRQQATEQIAPLARLRAA